MSAAVVVVEQSSTFSPKGHGILAFAYLCVAFGGSQVKCGLKNTHNIFQFGYLPSNLETPTSSHA